MVTEGDSPAEMEFLGPHEYAAPIHMMMAAAFIRSIRSIRSIFCVGIMMFALLTWNSGSYKARDALDVLRKKSFETLTAQRVHCK